jgi:hypothetical protein
VHGVAICGASIVSRDDGVGLVFLVGEFVAASVTLALAPVARFGGFGRVVQAGVTT